jgi:Domain of unknown function (DUF4832)/Beta-galactosidase
MKDIHAPRLVLPVLLMAVFFLCLIGVNVSADNSSPANVWSKEDINGDGRVNISDAIALLLRGKNDPGNTAYDYNGDGGYTVTDAITLLLNIVRNKLTPLEVSVEPVETDELLLNPGVGFCSPNCTDSNLRGWNPRYPLCANAYYRWYWNEIEPADGEIDFHMIDSVIASVQKDNQAFTFRVMCQNGSLNVPQWLIDKGLKGQYYSSDLSGGFQPDYTDTLFIQHQSRLIRALAERYDGHPDIAFVDIGTVGSWGEWNSAGAPSGFELPPDEDLQWVVDLYLESFTKTKLIMLIGGNENLTYSISQGAGYRADCLGDYGMWGPNWNHMEYVYPQAIAASEAEDAWMHAPIAFEACGTGSTWYTDGMGGTLTKEETRDKTIQLSLDWHISTMHMVYGPNYSEVPDEWLETYDEWAKKMGYRFVLQKLTHQSFANAGDTLSYQMQWQNRGVAPCYYNHPLAFEFRAAGQDTSWVVTDESVEITGWMPGEISLDSGIKVPEDMPPGEYELGITMLDLTGEHPRIKFAIEGVSEDGWYRLSRVTVR